MKRLLSRAAPFLPALVLFTMGLIGYDLKTAEQLRIARRDPLVTLTPAQAVRLYYSKEQDDSLYYEYASLMAGGGPPHTTRYAPWINLYRPVEAGRPAFPYRDFHAEYPPLAFLALLPPRLGSPSPKRYHRLFALEIALFLTLAVTLAVRIRQRQGDPVSWARISTYAACAGFLIGPLIIQRYDLVPAVIMLAAYAALSRGDHSRAGIWIAAGGATKIYPLIAWPLPVLLAWQQHGWKSALRVALTATATLLFCAALPWLLSPAGFLDMFRHHTGRGLEIESLYSVALQIWNWFHPGFLTWVSRSMSDTVVGGPSAILARLSLPVMILTLLGVLAVCWRRRQTSASDPFWLWACMVLTLTFVILSPIASPQFVIWFLPLVLAAPHAAGHRARVAFLIYAAATQLQFDGTYHLMHRLHPVATLALILRWGACAFFAWISCLAFLTPTSLKLRNPPQLH